MTMTVDEQTHAAARLAGLRGWMAAQGVDGLLLTTADAHQSENPPDHDRSLCWLTGFTGSLGQALVLPDAAVLFVDGRYQAQARQEVPSDLWQIAHLHDTPPATWPAAQGLRIGFDPMLWTVDQQRSLARGPRMVPLPNDPFQAIWNDRPAPPRGKIRSMTSPDRTDKLGEIGARLRKEGIDLWAATRPDDIAWLFDIRGSDVEMNPLALSFALIAADGTAEWFVDAEKLSSDPPTGVSAYPMTAFLPRLALRAANLTVGLDPAFAPVAVADCITTAGGTVREQPDPVMLRKACKSPVELAGYRRAHLADAVAWARFLAWLDTAVPTRAASGDPVTECEAADAILTMRRAESGFLEPSFATISAAGPNAAMCHYSPSRERDMPILPDMLFLLDSGGQYLDGTTDATRTVAFGPQSATRRAAATAVLRGFLALSMARFPTGTFPHQLDALARAPLWAMGLDYDHGTGHGVGHNLLVHEYPHRFGKRANPFRLEPGNIMTIEPGYYRDGDYGLRVENQVELVAAGEGFCAMEPLTLVPIDLSFTERADLSQGERTWLNAYHTRVRDSLMSLVPEEVRDWLTRMTRPI